MIEMTSMLQAPVSTRPTVMALGDRGPVAPPTPADDAPNQLWRVSLELIARHMPFTRRTLRQGQAVQRAGTPFSHLYIVNLGACKTVNRAATGREHLVGLHFKGDWIGFDCIAAQRCACDVYAMDTSEVWSLHYATLLRTASRVPALMVAVHFGMSDQLARQRDGRLSLGTLSASARVASFVLTWAQSLDARDLRHEQVALRLTRAEIGSYLGLALETVSRAFSELARIGLIRFDEGCRQTVGIPSILALAGFVQSSLEQPERRTLQ